MKVYRLEDKDGVGIYNVDYYGAKGDLRWELSDKFGIDLAEKDRHPAPFEDPGIAYYWNDDTEKWFFGYVSIEQYKTWWPWEEVRRALKDYGVRLSVYEVSDCDVHYSEKQAIFIKDDLKPIYTLRPDEV